ncbi:NAD-dependent succinate-semialdehyde dehydrogenase [Capnocytophaga sp.]|uniref:NAD-dependent succinate-semialdehyde dehydrogenase n=1 Tax=Capnocytophaga sp. TaxID=44737 RepID=UPI0026DAA7EF|nr:NAD-dependent succinate-semialdehyde dehydrogenase [Capnocytophaga sp.]MDO5105911.1 NAD-dependent succinate-semialdehyde dehydrogenase [Capnocytophaga sp.]
MEKITLQQAFAHLEQMQKSYSLWKDVPLQKRIDIVLEIKNKLLTNTELYARAVTEDMNKPIAQSIDEVKKCAYLCEYYAQNAEAFLTPQHIKTKWTESYVVFEPMGVLLGVMPWNFPLWQVFRFVIPNLILGNLFVVKHASNTPKSAELLESIFNSQTIDYPLYKNLPLDVKFVSDIIAHKHIKGVSLTGSDAAGRAVAQCAGQNLKKTVLELGGNSAFIICEDADLDLVLPAALNARMRNAGQSCIAAKRFLVHNRLKDVFLKRYQSEIEKLKAGDKFDYTTEISEMAREDLAVELEKMVNESIAKGAKLICGGKRKGAFFQPTLLSDVTPEMPVFTEETFGPVAVVTAFDSFEEAVALSNQSEFGLGVCIFSKNTDFIKSQVHHFEEGAVYINEMLISDPHLPFGGVKNSGYGRELSQFGLYEFANIKTIIVK